MISQSILNVDGKPKVLLISLVSRSQPGARSIQLGRLVEALNSRGKIALRVLSLSDDGLALLLDGSPVNLGQSALPWGSSWRRLLRDLAKDCDIVLSCSNPVLSHICGLYLSWRCSLPWIAFFSDPRPTTVLPDAYSSDKSWIKSCVEWAFVWTVLKVSDVVIFTSKYTTSLMSEAFNIQLSTKTVEIPHVGFVKSSNILVEPLLISNYIIYGGKTNRRFSSEAIEGFRMATDAGLIEGLIVFGGIDAKMRHLFSKDLHTGVIVEKNPVSIESLICLQAGARINLVVEAPMTVSPFLPSKFAELRSLSTPILAITSPKSAIRDYLGSDGGGLAVGHSRNEVYRGVERLISIGKVSPSKLFTPDNVSRQYERVIFGLLSSTVSRRQ